MTTSWISSFQFSVPPKKITGPVGFAYFIGHPDSQTLRRCMDEHAMQWQLESLRKNEREMIYFTGRKGPVWILRAPTPQAKGQYGALNESSYSWTRDVVGSLLSYFRAHQLSTVVFEMIGTDREQETAAFLGLDLAAYNFREVFEEKAPSLPKVYMHQPGANFDKGIIKDAQARAAAVNLARHLVNLPPNAMNPTTFKDYVSELKWGKGVTVEIWNEARLKKEKCNLMLAVGQGSSTPPCLVHIRYRPTKKKTRPVAFVGKGITFDTGGLDIKPSAGMRLMKKDMGGAAAVAAVAYWCSQSQVPVPCDFYLALAENSVDGKSFRPSDVVHSRSGLTVEIDNTDAEGRLVLADALDVAVSQKGNNEPQAVVDVATLTGAIKVGLGADVAGLFTNDDGLADALLNAAQRSGDYLWRMPLVEKYFSPYASNFADFKNSAEGFGGAITAALFLQKFVRGKIWAHLDIYAWADKGSGPISGGSANGQAVQCLIDYLDKM